MGGFNIPLSYLAQALQQQTPQENAPLGGPPNFLLTGQGPQPAQKPGALSRLGALLRSPEATTALTTAGLSLLRPNYQGVRSNVVESAGRAMQAVYAYQQMQRQREAELAKRGIEERGMKAEERKTAAEERRTAAEEQRTRETGEYQRGALMGEAAGRKQKTEQFIEELKVSQGHLKVEEGIAETRRQEAKQREKEYADDLEKGRASEAARLIVAQQQQELHRAQLRVEAARLNVELLKLKTADNEQDVDLLLKLMTGATSAAEAVGKRFVYTNVIPSEAEVVAAEGRMRNEINAQFQGKVDTMSKALERTSPERAARLKALAAEVAPVAAPPVSTTPAPAKPEHTWGPSGPKGSLLGRIAAGEIPGAFATPAPTAVAPTRPSEESPEGQPTTRPEGTVALDPLTGIRYVSRGGKWARQ